MYKNRQNVCPICGSVKLVKMGRVYICSNGDSFYTGDVIPKFKFKKGTQFIHKCKR